MFLNQFTTPQKTINKCLLFFCLLLCNNTIFSQEMDFMPENIEQTKGSIHAEQAEEFENYTTVTEEKEAITFLNNVKSGFFPSYKRPLNCRLKKTVYGYHPYWTAETNFLNYDYSLLSTFCFFAYDLNSYTGNYKTIHNWQTTQAITLAQNAGCDIELCITNFGGDKNARFLQNKTAWTNFVKTVIPVLDMRNANGINLDFENVYQKNGANLVSFVQFVSNQFALLRPGTRITMAIPPYTTSAYPVTELSNYVDKFIIMAYDYHCSDSKQAGPVAPLNGSYSIESSVNKFLSMGIHPDKFVLAVPYYGREWKTQSSTVPSASTQYLKAPTYSQIKSNYATRLKPRWHTKSATPYFVKFANNEVSQCWYDNENSLEKKYDYAINNQLNGVAIWALGYDDGTDELWKLLENKFVECNGTAAQQNYMDWLDKYFKSKK